MQKWCFYGGLLGFAIIVIILLVSSKTDFISSFNTETAKLFGMKNGYAGTLADAGEQGDRRTRRRRSAWRARSASRCCWSRC